MTDRPLDNDIEAAFAINMTILCRDLHVLPKAGGLLDQDSYHIWLIQETLAVLNEKEKRDMDRQTAEAKSAAKTRR